MLSVTFVGPVVMSAQWSPTRIPVCPLVMRIKGMRESHESLTAPKLEEHVHSIIEPGSPTGGTVIVVLVAVLALS
jgi:hypothetical protein